MALAFIDHDIPWYVVRTGVRAEEKAYVNLLRAGFRDTYLPRKLVETINHRTHIRRRKTLPLMPRYLFLGLRHSDFALARECEGVEYILCEEGRSGKPILVPGKDIEEIFMAERNLLFDDTREARAYRGELLEHQFPKGAKVRVKVEHLLAGFEGIVLGVKGKDRVTVEMPVGKVELQAEVLEVS